MTTPPSPSPPPPLPPRRTPELASSSALDIPATSFEPPNEPQAAPTTPPPSRPPSLPARKPTPSPIRTPSHQAVTPAVAVTPATRPSRQASGAIPEASVSPDSQNGPHNPAPTSVDSSIWTSLEQLLPYPDILVVGMLLLDLWWTTSHTSWVLTLGLAYFFLRYQNNNTKLRASNIQPPQ